jgi:hypothetical protein
MVMNHLKLRSHLLKILNDCSNARAAFLSSLVHSVQDRICEWITCLDYYLSMLEDTETSLKLFFANKCTLY